MATLTVAKPRVFETGDVNGLPMIAAEIIYEGAAAGIVSASGHVRPLVAGDDFAGFAEADTDNSAGAAAAINCRVRKYGDIELPISGVAITDIGAAVYASDDDTFTLTSTSNSFIGYIRRFAGSGKVIVYFDTLKGGS